jgi:hypothetical protein
MLVAAGTAGDDDDCHQRSNNKKIFHGAFLYGIKEIFFFAVSLISHRTRYFFLSNPQSSEIMDYSFNCTKKDSLNTWITLGRDHDIAVTVCRKSRCKHWHNGLCVDIRLGLK